MLVSLAACTKNTAIPESDTVTKTSEQSTAINNTEENKSIDTKKTEDLKILVAYFSATHTTEGIAEYIAEELSSDIYEIVPKEQYTEEDLNYSNSNSRSTVEMNDAQARPVITGSVENMEQYDVVFLGYPIWWGEAPRIISTFVESYDFSSKTIIPFCTSGSSGIGSSATNLQALTNNANWLSGQRFSGESSKDTIAYWIEELNIN
ncbi:flavodoxin [Clostridium sp. ASF356]|nr:flavodoxin [Clostridium sp. MD294]NDO47009.1 flavodoxin [Clostridium sp. MD294]